MIIFTIQSRNDYLALISRLENTVADTAKGVKPVQIWHGIDWPSLIAEKYGLEINESQMGLGLGDPLFLFLYCPFRSLLITGETR